MNDVTTYGLDLAKQVFQVHWVDVHSGEIQRKTLRRAQVNTFFARAPRGVVAMEACGSAHHWGRVLQGLGHQVKLIAAQFVRPFVKTNNNRCCRCPSDLGSGTATRHALCGGEE